MGSRRRREIDPDSAVPRMKGGASDLMDVPFGATWQRVDLHLHTPGVLSFRCPPGSDLASAKGRSRLVEEYVDRLCDARVAICAITDYNGVRKQWFEPIRARALERGITVLPGAELSFNQGAHGLHLISVFPAETSVDTINAAIRSLDRMPGWPLLLDDRTHRDIDLRTDLPDAVDGLRRDLGCLVILPHPGQKNGLFQTLQPKEAAQRLRELRPDAVEHFPENEVQRLSSTGIVDFSFLSRLSKVEFSDPKSLDEIGTKTTIGGVPRTTWLKLSDRGLSAIRLALHDPETRVCVGSLPEPRHAHIERMEVDGSGFLGRVVVAWNVDLNVMIGGRGTGKSALIETLRYALGIPPYSELSYRESLVRYALGSGGKVVLLIGRPIEAGFRRYRVERVLGESPRVYDEESGQQLDIAPVDLFGPGGAPAVFGQREIYAISGEDEYRLRLLDDLIGEEARARARAVEEAVEALQDNARRMVDAARKLSRRDEIAQRLTTIAHELSLYEQVGMADRLQATTDLRTDGQHLRAAAAVLRQVREAWEETRSRTNDALLRAAEPLRTGRSAQRAILAEAAGKIEGLVRELTRLGDAMETALDDASRTFQIFDHRWRQASEPLEEELNRIKQELHAESLDPDRFLALTAERTALGPLLAELDRLDDQRRQLSNERRRLLDDLGRRRLEEHRLRREQADAIGQRLRGRIRLQVEFKGQKKDYRERLWSVLKGSRLTGDVLDRLVAPDAADGASLAATVRSGPAAVEARFGLASGMAQRLVSWLMADEERLFELETLIPPDAVHVELRVDGEFRPLDRLSMGQRATAILLLLFALQGRILVLDQPEDDLDNRFVYEDVVSILRDQKGLAGGEGRRQVIAATHNANIPVLGDAEQVVGLEVDQGRIRVISRSSRPSRYA